MFQSCKIVCLNTVRLQTKTQLRHISHENAITTSESRTIRNRVFDEEKKRQKSALGRIEKIDIECKTGGYKVNLVMNKHISTPYDCARHISEGLVKTSIVALYNDMIWDMHDPLPENGELQFLNILNPVHMEINNTYWRSCSFLLGAVLDSAFKANVKVCLHSFPPPDIQSGSFSHYAVIDFPRWNPGNAEMTALTAEFVKLAQKNYEIEKLNVDEQVALEIFKDNPYKVEQIPHIVKRRGKVTLYRVGDHIDISKGPMMGNTYMVGRVTLTAGCKMSQKAQMYSFQGVSLPKGIMLNSFAYSLLEKNARNIIPMWGSLLGKDGNRPQNHMSRITITN